MVFINWVFELGEPRRVVGQVPTRLLDLRLPVATPNWSYPSE
jgi:hypothetical protein